MPVAHIKFLPWGVAKMTVDFWLVNLLLLKGLFAISFFLMKCWKQDVLEQKQYYTLWTLIVTVLYWSGPMPSGLHLIHLAFFLSVSAHSTSFCHAVGISGKHYPSSLLVSLPPNFLPGSPWSSESRDYQCGWREEHEVDLWREHYNYTTTARTDGLPG